MVLRLFYHSQLNVHRREGPPATVTLGELIPPLQSLKPAWAGVRVVVPDATATLRAAHRARAITPDQFPEMDWLVNAPYLVNAPKTKFADSLLLVQLAEPLPEDLCEYERGGVKTRRSRTLKPPAQRCLFILQQSKQHTAEEALEIAADDVQREFDKCVGLADRHPFLLLVLSDAAATSKPAPALPQAVYFTSAAMKEFYGEWLWNLRRHPYMDTLSFPYAVVSPLEVLFSLAAQ